MKNCNHSYFRLFKRQLFPKLGTFASIISPNSFQVFPLIVKVERAGQVRIAIDLNLVFQGSDPIQPDIQIDLLRDEKSIINGPQTLIAIRPILIEASYSLVTIDQTVIPGAYTYKIVLTNNSVNPFSIDYYDFNVKCIINSMGKFISTQEYPPTGTSALVISGGKTKTIDLPRIKSKYNQAKLTISANLNWPIFGINLLFDILRNGKTIINGPQTMLRALTGGSLEQKQEVNFTFDVVDPKPITRTTLYQIKFINLLNNVSVDIDYFFPFLQNWLNKPGQYLQILLIPNWEK